MARFEGKITSAAEARLELEELLSLMEGPVENPFSPERCEKLARFLSGEDVGDSLHGAFADKGLKREQ
ncbi:hypothetical protein [Sphingomicrobium marinum]|uniref:hypothetical protein n=1 Tax=Sphingomicrobium marinum TaxID=1227950 RepID=UPI0022404000|nr:hypothetical protein [Sphingomicrobium marinum]